MSDRPKIYRLDKPSGAYPEGSAKHGVAYSTVYLNDSGVRLGLIDTLPDGSLRVEAEFGMVEYKEVPSEKAAVEYMLRIMLEAGQRQVNEALIALGRM